MEGKAVPLTVFMFTVSWLSPSLASRAWHVALVMFIEWLNGTPGNVEEHQGSGLFLSGIALPQLLLGPCPGSLHPGPSPLVPPVLKDSPISGSELLELFSPVALFLCCLPRYPNPPHPQSRCKSCLLHQALPNQPSTVAFSILNSLSS